MSSFRRVSHGATLRRMAAANAHVKSRSKPSLQAPTSPATQRSIEMNTCVASAYEEYVKFMNG